MDGKRLSYELRQLLNEEEGSNQIDSFTTFNLLNRGAVKLNQRIKHIKKDQSITTVADQTDYTLDADYLSLYREDNLGYEIVKYSDGTTMHNLRATDEDSFFRNQTNETVTSVTIPDSIAIVDDKTLDSQVSGTTTSAGAAAAGKATLTDTGADFTDVSGGDTVHNTSDGSMGVVISKTSSTVLVTALFGGTDNDWSSADAYVIQPQARYKIVLEPPPKTAGHTVTVPYIARPVPVYSDYDMFRFPSHYMDALIYFSAGFYKFRSDEPNFGNVWFQQAELAVRATVGNSNRALNKKRVRVNLKRRQRNV